MKIIIISLCSVMRMQPYSERASVQNHVCKQIVLGVNYSKG